MNEVYPNHSINLLKYGNYRNTNNNNYINITILYNYYIIKKIIFLLKSNLFH